MVQNSEKRDANLRYIITFCRDKGKNPFRFLGFLDTCTKLKCKNVQNNEYCRLDFKKSEPYGFFSKSVFACIFKRYTPIQQVKRRFVPADCLRRNAWFMNNGAEPYKDE